MLPPADNAGRNIVINPKLVLGGAGALGLAFLAGLTLGGRGLAQQTPPTQSIGVSTPKSVSMDLGPEIEGMAGRQLRLRVLRLEPGGVFAVHNHRDRPTVEFVWSGSPVEFRDEVRRVVGEGEAVLSDRNTTHWWRNEGTEPVVFVAADIFRPQ
jgi:mannose-6-phosphate isomerase-like protein (cupin superfamily)